MAFDGVQHILANLEVEQALLAALLVRNGGGYDAIADTLRPEHFASDVHARIFDAIGTLVARNEPANPVTLKRLFDQDDAIEGIGGSAYLARLARCVVTLVNNDAYAKTIRDLWLRRQMVAALETGKADAELEDLERPAEARIEATIERLTSLVDAAPGASGLQTAEAATAKHLEAMQEAYKAGGVPKGLATGLSGLDRCIGSLRPGLLYFLGARPSMGKSQVAGAIAWHVARTAPVAICSLEMTAEEWVERWIARLTGISAQRQAAGQLNDNEWQRVLAASRDVGQRQIHIDDTGGLTVAQIRQRVCSLARRQSLGLVVIDHINIIAGSAETRRGGNDTSIVTEITRELKAMAKELQVPVLALSQLNRDLERREDKRPNLADLRQSGSIEQDADVVMFLYRRAYYLEREEPQRRAEEADTKFNDRVVQWESDMESCRHVADLIVAKQRRGKIGVARLYWDGDTSTVRDLEERYG